MKKCPKCGSLLVAQDEAIGEYYCTECGERWPANIHPITRGVEEMNKKYCSYWKHDTEETDTCSGWQGKINPLKEGLNCGTCEYWKGD